MNVGKLLRIFFTIFLAALAAFQGRDFPARGSGAGASQSVVSVEGRRLLVGGNPFFVRGVGYAPTPIGADPEVAPPNGDYFTAGYSALYSRDLSLLRKMGANTIRLWGWNAAADHTAFLDAAYNGGSHPIFVIVSFWINGGQNLADPVVRQGLVTGFTQMVALHKNHPAVLIWMVGNELNAPWMYGNSDALFSLINDMARAAHQEEGAHFHPVTTPLADVNLAQTIEQRDAQMPDLDLWSVQVYRGSTFSGFFADYAAASSKPLLVSEFGIDAYDDARGAEYELTGEPKQALYASALWREIADCPVCVGGSIMAYSDEWWKGKHGQTDSGHPTCPEYGAAVHSACGYANASHPDGYANEEWWGVVRPVKNGSQPDVMQPRAAYYALQSLWTKQTFLTVLRR